MDRVPNSERVADRVAIGIKVHESDTFRIVCILKKTKLSDIKL